jgi:hypothetical protein
MSVVGVFTFGVGVMDQDAKAGVRIVDRRVLQHRLITIAVADGEDRSLGVYWWIPAGLPALSSTKT